MTPFKRRLLPTKIWKLVLIYIFCLSLVVISTIRNFRDISSSVIERTEDFKKLKWLFDILNLVMASQFHTTLSMTLNSYDAFVIYNPVGSDLEFVQLLASIMESPPYNLRLFVPWRDQVHGDNYISADLIENKCRKCIVVLSPNFAGSQSAEFQLKYATSLSPANLHNRVIPICVEKCKVPEVLRYMCILQYHKTDIRPWFWKRLCKAFTTNGSGADLTGLSGTKEVKEGVSLPDIILDTSSHTIKLNWTV